MPMASKNQRCDSRIGTENYPEWALAELTREQQMICLVPLWN